MHAYMERQSLKGNRTNLLYMSHSSQQIFTGQFGQLEESYWSEGQHWASPSRTAMCGGVQLNSCQSRLIVKRKHVFHQEEPSVPFFVLN